MKGLQSGSRGDGRFCFSVAQSQGGHLRTFGMKSNAETVDRQYEREVAKLESYKTR